MLILGAAGMLGHKLCQLYRGRFDTWATVRSSHRSCEHYGIFDTEKIFGGVDVGDFDSVIRAVAAVKPNVVINCIGIIKQLKAAKDPIASHSIKLALAPSSSQLCRASAARLIHISTDCVFSGRKGMYTEADVSDAEDLYGRSKFLGEVDMPGCPHPPHLHHRPRTQYGQRPDRMVPGQPRPKGPRFTKAIYSGFTTKGPGQILADILENHPTLSCLYQVSSEPISKYDLLTIVNETYSLNVQIEPDASFVCDRTLDSTRFRQATGFTPPSWVGMIREMHRDPQPIPIGECRESKRQASRCHWRNRFLGQSAGSPASYR